MDMGWCGFGNRLELHTTLQEIKEESGCARDGIVLQDFIHGTKEVPTFQFYLHKSGEIFWLGTTVGKFDGFEWTGGIVDWDKQDYYKDLVYE